MPPIPKWMLVLGSFFTVFSLHAKEVGASSLAVHNSTNSEMITPLIIPASSNSTELFSHTPSNRNPRRRRPLTDQERLDLFLIFAKKFGRMYETYQFATRFENFNDNLTFMLEHNDSRKYTYNLGVNQFADFSWQEFQDFVAPENRFGGAHLRDVVDGTLRIEWPDTSVQDNGQQLTEPITDFPSTIDWARKNVVLRAKNQGTCAASAAFTAITTIESRWGVENGEDTMQFLSAQSILDCSSRSRTHGCRGDTVSNAFYDIVLRKGKVCGNYAYPYKNKVSICKAHQCETMAMIDGFVSLKGASPYQVLASLQTGPIAAGFPICDRGIQFYHSGVFQYSPETAEICKTAPTVHYMAVIGYGTDENGVPYFDCMNSWGEIWGKNGRITVWRPLNAAEAKSPMAVLRPDSYPRASKIVDVAMDELGDKVKQGENVVIDSFSGAFRPGVDISGAASLVDIANTSREHGSEHDNMRTHGNFTSTNISASSTERAPEEGF